MQIYGKTIRVSLALAAALWALPAPTAAQRGGSSADQVRVKAVLSQDALRPGDTGGVALILNINPGWHINSSEPGVEGLLATEVRTHEVPAQLDLGEWSYPEGHEQTFAFSPEPLSVYEKKVIFTNTVTTGTPSGEVTLEGTIRVQACNDRLCLRPGNAPFRVKVAFREPGAAIAALNQELFPEGTLRSAPALLDHSTNATAAGAATTSESPGNKVAQLLQDKGSFLAFLAFFGWGFLMCLTPCVFPMIPITTGFFASQSGGSRAKALTLAILYGQGLAVVYGILGTVAGITGMMLGAILQNDWVRLSIAAVLAILSLSMFGLYEFRIPGMGAGAQGRAGYFGAFGMGAFLGIVAAPCIGPLSVALLTYVGERADPMFGFWAFFVLAQGLALPFMILAVFTEMSLPRGGEWMVWVKKVMGVMILGLALWYLEGFFPRPARPWIFLTFAVLGTVYLAFLERTGMHLPRFRAVKSITGVALLACAGVFFWIFQTAPSELSWNDFSVQALETEAERGKAAMVDFFADWCIPCKELEHVTFSEPAVARILQDFTLYKADLTRGNDTTDTWTETFEIMGVPTVVFFDGQGRERLRVQEFVGPEELLRRLHGAGLITDSAFDRAQVTRASGEPAEAR